MDCVYYTTSYVYDNAGGQWYDTSMADPANGGWLPCDAPDDPGFITGGDNWSDTTINGTNYAQDTVSGNWYVDAGYDQDYFGEVWSACSDPTQSGGSGGGDSGGSGGGSGDGSGGDSGGGSGGGSGGDPGPGSLTVGSLLVDVDAQVTGGFAVDHDFSIGATVFDPSNLTAVYDANQHFLGWQLFYPGLQNGVDAAFATLTLNAGMSVPEITGNVNSVGGVSLGGWYNGVITLSGLGFSAANWGAAPPAALWHWQQNGAATPADQMTFDYNANFNLYAYGNSSMQTLSLKPGVLGLGTQSGANATVTRGLLTVSATAASTVLTLADGFVLDAGARSLRLGNTTITGSDSAGALVFTSGNANGSLAISPANQSLVFSNGLSVSGNGVAVRVVTGGAGVALGGNATASGNNAVAVANGVATGNASVAVGGNSSATSSGAVALGANSAAAANGAVALGGGNATASQALAIGPGTVAQNWGVTVVGHYNVSPGGNATAYAPGDPAFIVGIGANATARANGLVINNNGDAVATGNATLTHPAYVSPTNATQPVELQVNGAATFNGPATLNGNVILVAPQGSLPMGAFGN